MAKPLAYLQERALNLGALLRPLAGVLKVTSCLPEPMGKLLWGLGGYVAAPCRLGLCTDSYNYVIVLDLSYYFFQVKALNS